MLRGTGGVNGAGPEPLTGGLPGRARFVPSTGVPWVALMLLAVMALAVTTGSGCEKAEEGSTSSATVTSSPATSTTAGGSGPGPVLAGNFGQCPDCHARFDASVGKDGVLLQTFTHQLHFDQGVECDQCHQVPTHREDSIAKPTMAKCFACHSQEGGSAPPGACDACHPAGFDLEPSSHARSDWLPAGDRLDQVKAEHSVEALAGPEECAVCHAASFCQACHKVDMPHPDEWVGSHPATARSAGADSCATCHPDRNLCNSCHHAGFETGGRSWKEAHRDAVATVGALSCFECHNSATCAHCHTTGEYKAF